MILYDRRLKIPSYVKDLQQRSSRFATASPTDGEDEENQLHLEQKTIDRNQFVNIKRQRENLDHKSERRKRFFTNDNSNVLVNNSDTNTGSSHNNNHPFKLDEFSQHRICCRHVMDDFTVAPNFALRLEKLRNETKRNELCRVSASSLLSSSSVPTNEQHHEQQSALHRRFSTTLTKDNKYLQKKQNCFDSDGVEKDVNEPTFSEEFQEVLFRAGEKRTAAEIEESMNLKEIQRRRRQQQFIILPKTRPHSAGALSKSSRTTREAADADNDDESNKKNDDASSTLFNQDYHSSSRPGRYNSDNITTQQQKRPFSASSSSSIPKLSKLFLVAAKTLEQERLDSQLDALELQEHEKEAKRQQLLLSSRKEELTHSRQLGFSCELSTLERVAAEKNYSLTVQSHVNKMPMRFGRQYRRNGGSGGVTNATSDNRSGSNSPVRVSSPSPPLTSSSRPTSASGGAAIIQGFFLTTSMNGRPSSSSSASGLKKNFVVNDDEDDHEDVFDQDSEEENDENDIVERRLLACLESKKVQLRPSSSTERKVHTEQHERRAITPVFRMKKDSLMYRSWENHNQQKSQKPNKKMTTTTAAVTAINTNVPRPPSARKNVWLPDGALSNAMIRRSKYVHESHKTKTAEAISSSSEQVKRSTSPRTQLKGENKKVPPPQQQLMQQTLQDVILTPRGQNKNASFDPMNSARRANADRTADVGMLVGQKAPVMTMTMMGKNKI